MKELRCVAPAEYTNPGPCDGQVEKVVLDDDTTVVVCEVHRSLYPLKKDLRTSLPPAQAENQNPT